MELEWAWPWTWKTVLITIVLLSSKDLHGRTSGCWEEERAALLQLKASINHPNSNFLPSWKEDDKKSNCCAWERVSCGFDERVWALRLANVRLQPWPVRDWHLNASVLLPLHELRELSLRGNRLVSWMEDKGWESFPFKLKNLEVLDLSYNVLDERVLSTLGTLSSLKKLDLSNNSLKGSIIHLHDLELIRNLEELDLSGNSLSSITTINSSEMRSLSFKTLKLLDLSHNDLHENVLSQLSVLSSLKHLSLSYNLLKGSIYVQDLEALEDLEELDLSDNEIHSFIATNGFEIPSRLKNLKVLNLGGNKFTTSNLSSLRALSSLRQLSLSDNNGLTGSINLHDIEVMQNLEELDLSYTGIEGFINTNKSHELSHMEILHMDGCVNLSQNSTSLGMMTSLRVLTLNAAMLNGELTAYGWLCQLKNLQVLGLGANRFSGTLPQCLINMTALRVLDLGQNQLLGNIVISPLTNLTLLEFLLLSDNFFQLPLSLSSFSNHSNLKVAADNNKIIPNSEIQSLVPKFQLQVLSLSTCTLGPSPPNFLYHQRDLRTIDLSHNFLQGDFPSWLIKNNTRLQGLFLQGNLLIGPFRLPFQPHPLWAISIAYNKMSGSIPTNMSLILHNLVWLDMSSNHFKGNVPSSFRDMKSLRILILSNNQFSGRLSKLFMADSSLETLDVSNNVLDGPITSISNLLGANFLFLQGNNFSRTISLILYLMELVMLDISNNSLSGELPRFTKINLPLLHQLDMSKNQLEGPIPNQYCELSLILLDISDNNLSGYVPSCLLSSISYLRLSNNRLSGSMPHAISVSSGSQLLDLSHNNLSGSIPKWIHSLETLRILILGFNQFEGKIPTELCKLRQLSILDLSNNDLSGPIPSCLNNITFQPEDVEIDIAQIVPQLTYAALFQNNPKVSLQLLTIIFFAMVEFDLEEQLIDESSPKRVKFTTKSTTYSYEGNMLRYMTGIDLSCNALSGEIPHEIGSFSEIQALNLSHNKFTSSIPETFSNLSQIESLDLSYNRLNGSIPFQLIELNSLAVFSVAHNNLSSKTPDFTRQFATFDESSYEGNPFLCGPPLSKSCYEVGSPSSSMPNFKEEEEEDDVGWIDMSIFYTSFWASYGTIFLAIITILLINSHWRRTWFYYVDAFIIYSYYFIVDSFRKLGKNGR